MATRQEQVARMVDWAMRRGTASEQAEGAKALAILDLAAAIRFHGMVTGPGYDDDLLAEMLRKAGVND